MLIATTGKSWRDIVKEISGSSILRAYSDPGKPEATKEAR
jgi:hypothetical protein